MLLTCMKIEDKYELFRADSDGFFHLHNVWMLDYVEELGLILIHPCEYLTILCGLCGTQINTLQ